MSWTCTACQERNDDIHTACWKCHAEATTGSPETTTAPNKTLLRTLSVLEVINKIIPILLIASLVFVLHANSRSRDLSNRQIGKLEHTLSQTTLTQDQRESTQELLRQTRQSLESSDSARLWLSGALLLTLIVQPWRTRKRACAQNPAEPKAT